MKHGKTILTGTVIAAALMGCPGVLQAQEPVQEPVQGSLEDGSYIVRIAGGDLGWFAEDMIEDESIVTLTSAEPEGEDFVIRFAPAGDGSVTVGARHLYNAFASDQVLTWDLKVEDGAITEVTGGSYSASPENEMLDPYITGTWNAEEKNVELTIATGAEGLCWDVEAVSSEKDNAYIFKTSIYYDCYQDAFLYDKGKFFSVPEEGASDDDLGEAYLYGTTGSFRFSVENEENVENEESVESEEIQENLKLLWADDEAAEEEILLLQAGVESVQ